VKFVDIDFGGELTTLFTRVEILIRGLLEFSKRFVVLVEIYFGDQLLRTTALVAA
jgi:hypothetical protein